MDDSREHSFSGACSRIDRRGFPKATRCGSNKTTRHSPRPTDAEYRTEMWEVRNCRIGTSITDLRVTGCYLSEQETRYTTLEAGGSLAAETSLARDKRTWRLAILLAICLAYANSSQNGFHFDDFHTAARCLPVSWPAIALIGVATPKIGLHIWSSGNWLSSC
jgi:hypothetical protein